MPQDDPTTSPGRRAPGYPDHARLLVVRDGQGAETPIASRADWQVRRAHILAHLQDVMGPLPGGERRVPPAVESGAIFDEGQFTRRKVSYAAEPGDRVPAWLLVPRNLKGTAPAVVCLHQTTRIGKDEPAGLGGKPNLAYAKELAGRGFVAIAPDYPGYGESKSDPYALGYASACMKAIWNNMRAVDLLGSLAEVDPARIGAIGHSLGGHTAIFTAVFDERLRAVVSSCGFDDFPHYYGGNIAGWSHRGYMPRLRSVYGLDSARVPFDFPELIGALAPRAFFANAPTRDDNFTAAGVDACIESARAAYRLFDAEARLRVVHPDATHDFPAAVRDDAYRFLEAELGR